MSEFSGLPAGSFQKVLFNEELPLADPREAPGKPPSVQFLSFSCSFRQKSCQIIGNLPQTQGLASPSLGNPRSTTDHTSKNQTSIPIILKNQKDDVVLM